MTKMKKLAKIIQTSRSNPTYFVSGGIMGAIREAVPDWEDVHFEAIENCPQSEAYELWLVPIDEEDRDWEDPDNRLEVGVYHEPPMAERKSVDEEYLYQPLLTGKRMQIHKSNAVVCAFDHNGNRLSGKIKIGETIANLSSAFLAIASIEAPDNAIFDAVMLAEDNSLVITDILLYGDCAAHEMSAVARMELLSRTIEENEGLSLPQWSLEQFENAIGRPAYEGYFSEWVVVPEGMGRNKGDQPGSGPGGVCECPECGHEVEHEIGQACNERECPECGATMTRKAE